MTYPPQPAQYQWPTPPQPEFNPAPPTNYLPVPTAVDNDDRAFQATIKGGKGYEASWIVVQAPTADLLKSRLEEVRTAGLVHAAEALSADYRAASALAAGGFNAQPVTTPPPAQYAPQAPAPAHHEQGPPPPWATSPIAPPVDNPGAPITPQGYPSTPQQFSAGPGGSCAHGARVWATGSGKNNRDWYAWDCPGKGTNNSCPNGQDRLWAKQNGELSARSR